MSENGTKQTEGEVPDHAREAAESIEAMLATAHKKVAEIEGTERTISGLKADIQKQADKAKAAIAAHIQQASDATNEVAQFRSDAKRDASAVMRLKAKADTHLSEAQAAKASVDSEVTAVRELKTVSQEALVAIQELNEKAKEHEQSIHVSKATIDAETKAIQTSKATVSQLEADLTAIAATADEKDATISRYKVQLEALRKKHDVALAALESSYAERYAHLEKKIEGLLPGATSAGLGNAFMKRKESIEKQKTYWRNMTILGAVGLVGFGASTIIFPPHIGNGLYEFLLYILTRSSILVGILMIEEFGRRHFNIIARLSEAYAYKEVLSRSFEGYKQQMHDVYLCSETIEGSEEEETEPSEAKPARHTRASSKLSSNLLDNLNIDPSTIFEKEKPVSAPVVDVPQLAAESFDKLAEHLAQNRFDIGWRLFAILLVVVAAAATVTLWIVG